MAEQGDYRLPPGRQVYDAHIGAKVGAFVGALLGAVLTALTVPVVAVSIPVLAATGAGAGYLWERRRIAAERPSQESRPPK